MLNSSIVLLTLSFFLQACRGSSEGHVPSELSPVTGVPSVHQFNIVQKNASTITTSNAWTIDADHTNTIKNKILSNGWQIEVVYE